MRKLARCDSPGGTVKKGEREVLDGYISDLQKGDVFRPVEFEVTPVQAAEYAHGVEENSEFFQSTANPLGRQVRPPTAIHTDKMRLLEANCLKERRVSGQKGPHARIHYVYDATFFEPVYVGDRIRLSGRIADRYWKRGREYLHYEIDVHHVDGRHLAHYSDHTLLRYQKDEEA